MANKRRQTLATGLKPPNNPSDASSSSQRTSRIPKSRKSMAPRVAGQENEVNGSSRQTMGAAGKASGIRAPSPAKSRKSMGPSTRPSTPSKNRRVSLAPTLPSDGQHGQVQYIQTDPRPKDKTTLLASIRKTISYLKKHRYPHASELNAQKLVSNGVSGRDFNAIMTFLFRRLDPGFNSSSGGSTSVRTDEPPMKFEDEVCHAFRILGYPLPISKTGIVAVGSPHTWPALIAAIDWLVDMLLVVEEENPHDWTDAPSEEELYDQTSNADRATRQFDEYLRKSMVAFLADDGEGCQALELELLRDWERDNEVMDGYLASVDGEVEAMKGEVERLERENESLDDAHQKLEEYAAEIEKFLALIKDLKEHQSGLQSKVSSLTAEKSAMETQMGEISISINKLKQIIGSQELTVDDVRKMERQKLRLEEQRAQKQKILDGHLNAIKEANEQYTRCYELLAAAVSEYNSKARDLQLIPETAKNAHGRKMEICLKEGAESVEELLGLDIADVVSHLKKVGEGYVRETREEKGRTREIIERMEGMEAEIKELDQEIESINDKIATSQKESTAEQQKLQSEIQAKQRQLQLLQTKITTLNDLSDIESTIAKNDKRYKELVELQKKQEHEILKKKKAVTDEIRRALEAAVEHDKFVQRTIDERNAYAQKKKKELNLKLSGCF